MALPTYSTGTASVAAGGTVVTGVGCSWTDINAKQGDFISVGDSDAVLITEVTDATHLKVTPWPDAAKSGQPYVIYQNYVGRVLGVAAAEDVGDMLEKLHVDGLPFIVGSTETVPDPSYGDDGQMAFSPTTQQWWTKTGGVWVLTPGLTTDASKVLKSGDVMTGNLNIQKDDPSLILTKPATGSHANTFYGVAGTSVRWRMDLGDGVVETGSGNVGSNFSLFSYTDAGAYIGTPLQINRATSKATFGGSAEINGSLTIPFPSASIELGQLAVVNTPYIDFHSSGSATDFDVRLIASGGGPGNGVGTCYFHTAALSIVGGSLSTGLGIYAAGTIQAATPTFQFGLVLTNTSSGYTKNFRTGSAGELEIVNHANTSVIATLSDVGTLRLNGYATVAAYACKPGIGGAYSGYYFNLNYTGGTQLWIDNSNFGTITTSSDYRIKKDIAELPSTWDTVKALRPISYTHKDFTPPSEENVEGRTGEAFFKGDGVVRWGFIAHELQETLVMSAATGVKDAPDVIQSPEALPIIAALTKALQEAMARIEALEAAAAPP